MIDITIADIMAATGAVLCLGDSSRHVRGVVIDSRIVGDAGMLVCFPGEHVDGNDFAVSAMESGAAAVVMTRKVDDETLAAAREHGCAILRARDDDAEAFLLSLASAWRAANPQWVVVGITGSVGKTTTRGMVSAALSTGMATHATKGNHNNLVGAPLTILSAPKEAKAVVVEMGMDHAGEMTILTGVVRPTVALVTNVGTSHIGNLGSREAIAKAKAEIVAGIGSEEGNVPDVAPCLFLTTSNDYASLIDEEFCVPVGIDAVRVGTGGCIWAEDVTIDGTGLPHLTVCCEDGERIPTCLNSPSRHLIDNLLLSVAVANRVGIDRRKALAAIAEMPHEGMRLNVMTGDGKPTVIDDSYNASPASMASGLDALCSLPCDGRRIAVIGEVGELGDAARHLHGLIGAYVAAKAPDEVVFVGTEMAGVMADAAMMMGMPVDRVRVTPDATTACDLVIPTLAEGDLVLAKGSRFVGLDLLARRLFPRGGTQG